jgi:O-glycosyl hydrolase
MKGSAMKYRYNFFFILSTVSFMMLPTVSSSVTVTIDPSIKYQQFEGWGTSLCWWAVQAGKWSEKNRNALIGAIVDPDTGLGYNCFRYNIGGGDQPGHTHLSEARAVPGFKTSENGSYDWTADQNQRNILQGIASRGKNMIFEAFSNSPPWWMTISGCVSGNTNGADNLKPAYFTAFAEYLVTVVKHYKDTWGITFRTVEPFNEPSSGYWKINGGQEGCGFKSKQSQMVKELGKLLVSKGLFPETMVSAADETSLEHTISALKSYDDSAFSFLSQINSHSYGGWNFRKPVDSLAKAHKKTLWQSESGPLGKSDSDPSDITMWMSHVIIQDLRVMKANAWIDWQVGDPVANWMTIQLDHTKQTFSYTKRYYMHAVFSRFLRPGSQIISSNDTNSVAALDSITGNLILILRNNANSDSKYDIDLSKFKSTGAIAHIYRFSLPGSLKKEADISLNNNQLSFTSPKLSITTCLIPMSSTQVKNHDSGLIANGPPRLTVSYDGRVRISAGTGAPFSLSIYDCRGAKIICKKGFASEAVNGIDLQSNTFANGMYIIEFKQGKTVKQFNCILKK